MMVLRSAPEGRFWRLLLGLALLLAWSGASALDVQPALGVTVIGTDNVRLAPKGQERKDIVTLAQPSLRLTSDGVRYDFLTDYRMDVLYYARLDDTTSIFNNLNSRLNLRLIGDSLFLNSRVSVSQVLVDPFEPVSTSNVPATDNRTNAIRYETQPEVRQMILGQFFRSTYTIGVVDYSDSDRSDQYYHLLNSQLSSAPRERGLGYNLVHSYRHYDYDDFLAFRTQLVQLDLVWEIGNGWAPFVSGGLESDWRNRTGAKLEDSLWFAGVRRSTERSFLEVSAGERSFGTSYNARFEYRYGAESSDIIRLSYSETPINSEEGRRQRLVEQDGLDEDFPDTVEAPGTGSIYTRKRAAVLVQRGFVRSTLSWTGFVDRNDNFLRADGTIRDRSSREYGSRVTFNYVVGQRTNWRSSATFRNRQLFRDPGETDNDRLWRVRTGVDYSLGRRTRASAWVAREEREGSREGLRNYVENQAGLSINRDFF